MDNRRQENGRRHRVRRQAECFVLKSDYFDGSASDVINDRVPLRVPERVRKPAQVNLTSREKEILILISAGAKNHEIATRLCRSIHTIKFHVYRIYKKTGSRNRIEAINWAKLYGVL